MIPPSSWMIFDMKWLWFFDKNSADGQPTNTRLRADVRRLKKLLREEQENNRVLASDLEDEQAAHRRAREAADREIRELKHQLDEMDSTIRLRERELELFTAIVSRNHTRVERETAVEAMRTEAAKRAAPRRMDVRNMRDLTELGG